MAGSGRRLPAAPTAPRDTRRPAESGRFEEFSNRSLWVRAVCRQAVLTKTPPSCRSAAPVRFWEHGTAVPGSTAATPMRMGFKRALTFIRGSRSRRRPLLAGLAPLNGRGEGPQSGDFFRAKVARHWCARPNLPVGSGSIGPGPPYARPDINRWPLTGPAPLTPRAEALAGTGPRRPAGPPGGRDRAAEGPGQGPTSRSSPQSEGWARTRSTEIKAKPPNLLAKLGALLFFSSWARRSPRVLTVVSRRRQLGPSPPPAAGPRRPSGPQRPPPTSDRTNGSPEAPDTG